MGLGESGAVCNPNFLWNFRTSALTQETCALNISKVQLITKCYTCIYIHTFIYVYMCVYIINIHLHLYIYVCVYMYIYICVPFTFSKFSSLLKVIHICICVHVYKCVYTHNICAFQIFSKVKSRPNVIYLHIYAYVRIYIHRYIYIHVIDI